MPPNWMTADMRVLLINRAKVPVFAYGGTERVIWNLARSLVDLGHEVTFLVPEGSHCDFAKVLVLDKDAPLKPQIPSGFDIVHFQSLPDFDPDADFDQPYIMTEHGNANKPPTTRYLNTVFISADQAKRHNSNVFVYNGLNWDDYGPVDFNKPRTHFHFLGKASWPAKNVRGAIDVAWDAGVELAVLGGNRLNFSRGFRFTWSPSIHFYGMVGGAEKFTALNQSKGLIFPVRWYEPFGLAIIESLYFGCPVFATPYGSLPELIGPDVGYLSNSRSDLARAVKTMQFDARRCHDYVRDTYNSAVMAEAYVKIYERVLNGEKLNPHRPELIDREVNKLPWLK